MTFQTAHHNQVLSQSQTLSATVLEKRLMLTDTDLVPSNAKT